MAWVRHFHDMGADHWHVGSDRHAIVEEARVLHAAVFAVDVLLVQRPADALYGAALDLPFHLQRVDRLAGVFDDRIAPDVDAPRLLVAFHAADGGPAARSGAAPARSPL